MVLQGHPLGTIQIQDQSCPMPLPSTRQVQPLNSVTTCWQKLDQGNQLSAQCTRSHVVPGFHSTTTLSLSINISCDVLLLSSHVYQASKGVPSAKEPGMPYYLSCHFLYLSLYISSMQLQLYMQLCSLPSYMHTLTSFTAILLFAFCAHMHTSHYPSDSFMI